MEKQILVQQYFASIKAPLDNFEINAQMRSQGLITSDRGHQHFIRRYCEDYPTIFCGVALLRKIRCNGRVKFVSCQ